jgi:hypothetical protein
VLRESEEIFSRRLLNRRAGRQVIHGQLANAFGLSERNSHSSPLTHTGGSETTGPDVAADAEEDFTLGGQLGPIRTARGLRLVNAGRPGKLALTAAMQTARHPQRYPPVTGGRGNRLTRKTVAQFGQHLLVRQDPLDAAENTVVFRTMVAQR